MPLPLNEIRFGKTDAFNELTSCGTDYFIDAFVKNPQYHIDDFISGSRYYICGKKGSGKSALLKYLECLFAENHENLVLPIRFYSEFNEIDKDGFEAISSGFEQPYDTTSIIDQTSYVLTWKTFLINQIIIRESAGEYRIFEKNRDYDLLVSLLKCIYGETSSPTIVMPKVTRGAISLTAKFAEALSTSLKVELDFDSNKKRINYGKISRKVCEVFSQLHYQQSPVYILIDELELSVRNKAAFEKDVCLVRDLIIAIDDMNKLALSKRFDIHIIAAVRSEVLTNVRSAGHELTKPIEDHGIEINWFQKGGSYYDNPLLTIIENKIRASEKQKGYEPTQDIWSTYFPSKINDLETRKYILNNSLYRPRDVIRMMTSLQNHIEANDIFTQELFDKAQQDYSKMMWTEITDELRLSFSAEEISAVLALFNRIQMPFSFGSLTDRIRRLGQINPIIPSLLDNSKLSEILNKLYELGVIGNTGIPMNFVFLGRTSLDLLDQMVIHTPLRSYFSVQYQ